MSSYLVFDTEFSKYKHYKRTGNPWYNKLVAIGLKSSNEVKPYSKWVYEDILKEFIVDEAVLIGHNLKVDILFIWHLKSLHDAFKRGLKVWDTSLAHYMLSGQREKFPALREIAVQQYGVKERPKVMEEYWDNGIDTCDIPQEIVLHDVENDVMDTESIYLQQVTKAKQMGMYELIEAHMDTLLGDCEIEYNGMFVDRERLINNRLKLERELQGEYSKLQSLVKRYWK